MDRTALLDAASEHLSAWIPARREVHRPHAAPLDGATITRLSPYFPAAVLAGVRVREVETIEQPELLVSLARDAGMTLVLSPMGGLTLVDTILIVHRPGGPNLRLLFHELVHVVQYAEFGARRFARDYVYGWANNGARYEAIPLEAQALALEEQFAAGPEAFQVGALVRDSKASAGPVTALLDGPRVA